MAFIAEDMVESAIGDDPTPITGRRDFYFVTEQRADALIWAVMTLANKIRELQVLLDEHEGRPSREEMRKAA